MLFSIWIAEICAILLNSYASMIASGKYLNTLVVFKRYLNTSSASSDEKLLSTASLVFTKRRYRLDDKLFETVTMTMLKINTGDSD